MNFGEEACSALVHIMNALWLLLLNKCSSVYLVVWAPILAELLQKGGGSVGGGMRNRWCAKYFCKTSACAIQFSRV